jgi:hypothetical protein
MRRMDAAATGEAFAAGMQARAAQAQFLHQLNQPLADLLAFVASILTSEEGDLVAIHGFLLTRIPAGARWRARPGSLLAILQRESRS